MMVALLMLVGLTVAAAPDQAVVEREAKQIERMLIAPCCWTQPVSDHYSAEADQIRTGIRTMLASGKTRQQILDAYVAQYGERILAEPPARGFKASLYVLPWIFLVLGGAVVFVAIRRLRSAGPAEAASETPASSDDPYAERLDEELRDLD
jgi:cytochrome c-type biogenesis protein CcmH